MKLSDTHLILLSKAARHDDRAVELPSDIEAVAAEMLVSKLAGAGLIEEIPSYGSLPVWRRLDDASFALRITDAGLMAIGAGGTTEAAGRAEEVRSKAAGQAHADATAKSGRTVKTGPPPKMPKPKARNKSKKRVAASADRSGTKLAQVKNLLLRKRGATIQDMIDATGWLPHTTRAVLTGLRKRGFTIEREALRDKPTVYRITRQPDSAKHSAVKGRKG